MILLALGLCAMSGPLACRSSRIEVDGGTNLLGPRRVKVGETFTITQPFDRQTGAEWKLNTYNRMLLEPVPRVAYETAGNGTMKRVYEFKAKAPGLAELEFLRRSREFLTPGEPPPEREQHTVKIRVVE